MRMKIVLASLALVCLLILPSGAQTTIGTTRYTAIHANDFEGTTNGSVDEIRAIVLQHLQEMTKAGEKETVYIVEVKVIEELAN